MKKAIAFVYLTLLACPSTTAQVQTTTKEQSGTPTTTTEVQRAEVVYIQGNDLVLRTEDGQIKHIVVPDGVTATVDGKELGVRDLKPGMTLQRTITTTTTPRTITTIRSVEGTVFHVSPPNSVILRMDNGENQRFEIPRGQKFVVNGRETDAFGLREGMRVSATAITEVPEVVMTQQIQRTGQMPPAPQVPPIAALLIVVPANEDASQSATPGPTPSAPTSQTPAAAAPATTPAPTPQSQPPQIHR